MTVATTNSVALYINTESTWGEAPSSPAMQQLRFTGESLVFGKQTAVSETIRSDRMRDQVALTSFATNGDINFELEYFDYDDLMAGALYSNWVGMQTVSGTNIAATATQITDAGNRLGNVTVNSYVWVSGFANKALNRRYRVTAAATGSITTSPAPAATESAGATVTLSTSGVSITMATTTLTIVAAASTITFGGSTGFNPSTATNLVAGQWVRVSGFVNAANNGVRRIASVSATVITFTDSNGSAETCTNGQVINIVGRRLRNGTTQKSFHIEKGFTDINQYMSFRGMVVSDMQLTLTSAEVITGSVTFTGKQAVTSGTTVAASTIGTNTTRMMTASANVGSIFQNGAAIPAGVREITLEVGNNLRELQQVGSQYPFAVGAGFMDVMGQVEVYFENSTMLDQLINHTQTELSWVMTDDDGNAYVITLPSVLFTEGYPQAGGGNDDVTVPLAYQAVRNATYNCQIQIDTLPSLA